jgi:hypothetical protein
MSCYVDSKQPSLQRSVSKNIELRSALGVCTTKHYELITYKLRSKLVCLSTPSKVTGNNIDTSLPCYVSTLKYVMLYSTGCRYRIHNTSFLFITYEWDNKARLFVLCKPFLPIEGNTPRLIEKVGH